MKTEAEKQNNVFASNILDKVMEVIEEEYKAHEAKQVLIEKSEFKYF